MHLIGSIGPVFEKSFKVLYHSTLLYRKQNMAERCQRACVSFPAGFLHVVERRRRKRFAVLQHIIS